MIKDGIAMNHTYTLLSKEQVFGEAPIDVIRALGTKCGVTDFGIISGADVDDEKQGKWFLSSASGYGDVCLVDSDGSQKVAYSTSPRQRSSGDEMPGYLSAALQDNKRHHRL